MKKTDIEIKLNNQIPKLNNELNKYHKNISLKFKGKVFLVDDNLNKIKELKNDDKIKKNGYYILKFIDEDNNIYFIKLKLCKYTILYFILLLTLIIFPLLYFLMPKTNTNINRQMLFDSLNYEYKFIGDRYVFNFNYGDENYKKVELYDKTTNTTKIHPGTSGQFYIKLNTVGGNKDIIYQMQVKEEVNKPTNLKFRLNNKIYNSIYELAQDINGNILQNSNKIIKIEWFWEYDNLDDEVSKFLSGFKMMYCNLISILERFGVKEIDGFNKPFDPTYHQAVMQEKNEKFESNYVIEVLRKGYILKDKVIRPAMVKVSE